MSIYMNIKKGKGLSDYPKVIFSSIIHPTKFPGERHVTGIDSPFYGKKYHFAGPFTNLKLRSRSSDPYDNMPLVGSIVDKAARDHDYDYLKTREDLENKKINRNEATREIWKADDKFINSVSTSEAKRVEPKLSGVVSTLMRGKEASEKALENKGIHATKVFSGIGKNPFERLIKKKKKIEGKGIKHVVGSIKKTKKVKKGGFAFLPFLAPVLASVLPDIAKFVYHKVTGDGKKGKGKKLYIK